VRWNYNCHNNNFCM